MLSKLLAIKLIRVIFRGSFRVSKTFQWALMALGGIALLGVAYFLLRPAPGASKAVEGDAVSVAINNAIRTCQLSANNIQKREIALGVRNLLAEPGAGGASTIEDVRSAYDATLSDQSKLIVDERIRTCMIERTNYYLALGSSINSSGQHPEAALATDETTGEPLAGFVYYEENEGSLTPDGVFTLATARGLPPYTSLRRGDILRATSKARVRSEAKQASDFLGQILAGQCLRVTQRPDAALQELKNASSGGWIFVQAARCPAMRGSNV